MSSKHAACQPSARTWRPRLTAVTSFVSLAFFACVSCTRSDPARHWSLDEIRSEFAKVKIPESAHPIQEASALNKYGATSVSGRYAANESDEEILKHYRTALVNDGWLFVTTVKGGDHSGESYCKNKLLATLELLNAGPPAAREYAFSISWGEISEKKCP
jgi:hypothetical protein